jgi:hypothetical protein
MKWRKKFAAATLFANFLVTAFMVKCVSAQQVSRTSGKVSIGLWGGSDLEMQVTPQGAELEFDCARGKILEPLLPDETGKFHAKGTFQTQHGPVRRDQPQRGIDVVYAGTVQGDTMQMEFALEDKELPEKFVLVRGQSGNLKKCH